MLNYLLQTSNPTSLFKFRLIDLIEEYKDVISLNAMGFPDDWEKEKEVTLEEMDDNPEIDSWVMKETPLSELIEDEKQKLLYVFDYMTERCFFIELSEIITGKEIKAAKCTKKEGNPPKQTVDFEEMALTNSSMDLDENFYGDQDFDIDEFDPEGFEGLNGDTAGGSFEEDRL